MRENKKIHPIDKHVGERLRNKRLEAGLSQEELGKAVGLTFQQIQKYERAYNRVSASKLHDFAKYLGVSISYFFDDPETVEYLHEESANFNLAEDEKKLVPIAELDKLVVLYTAISDIKSRTNVMDLVKSYACDNYSKSHDNKNNKDS